MRNLKTVIQMNLLTNKKRFIDIENKLMATREKVRPTDRLGIWN